MRLRVCFGIVLCLLARCSFAQSPAITHIAPLAIHPGTTNQLIVYGDHLGSVNSAWLSDSNSFAKVISSNSDQVRLEVGTDRNASPILGLCIASTNGISNLELIAVDILPLFTNKTSRLQLPAAVDGTVRESSSNCYAFECAKGAEIRVEIVANRIGSMLDPIVRLLSPEGKELVFGTDVPSVTPDSAFEYEIQQTGLYKIEIRDVGYQGGTKFFYHVKLFEKSSGSQFLEARSEDADLPEEQEPNNSSTSANKLEVPAVIAGKFSKPGDLDYFRFSAKKNQRLVISGKTRSIGSPCDLALAILDTNLQKIASSTAASNVDGALTNTFKTAGNYFLRAQELAGRGGEDCFYELNIAPFTPGFQLSTELNQIELSANKLAEIKITAQRFDYDGPITISILPPNAGILLENEIIPAKKNETTLKLKTAAGLANRLFVIQLEGSAKQNENNLKARVNVSASLHKQFPLLLYPPPNLDYAVLCWSQ